MGINKTHIPNHLFRRVLQILINASKLLYDYHTLIEYDPLCI